MHKVAHFVTFFSMSDFVITIIGVFFLLAFIFASIKFRMRGISVREQIDVVQDMLILLFVTLLMAISFYGLCYHIT